MKKNLISVIILALVFANLVLTAVLTFTIIPQTKKSNALIDKVCAAISLDLEAGLGSSALAVPIEDIETYAIADEFRANLKSSVDADGKTVSHYAMFSVSLSMNTKSDGYKNYKGAEGLTAKESIIRSEINTIVSNYSVEEFNANGYQDVKNDILQAIQRIYGDTEFIIGVNFSSVTTQ